MPDTPSIYLNLDQPDGVYTPGQAITGTVSWDFLDAGRPPESVRLRLLWQTSGKGTTDAAVVHETVFEMPVRRSSRRFDWPGVAGPYSFSGKLIGLAWVLEAQALPSGGHAEVPVIISPTGMEVLL